METKNIMIVGVGGQGSLLASKLLGYLLLKEGYDVKVSEVHGMSQRGGSVVTYVRFGDKVYSPIIDRGEADYIVSFEEMEAARYLPYLKEGGRIVTNTQQIDPMPVITGACAYPENLIEKLEELKKTIGIPASIKDFGVKEEDFLKTLDEMTENAFNDQCTGANPRYPLMDEIKQLYLLAYYGKDTREAGKI